MKTVGERHWTAGPLVLGSQKLHASVCKSFTTKQAKPLARDPEEPATERVEIEKFGNELVLTMRAEETGAVKWGDAVVLVHARETKSYLLEKDRVAAIASIDPKTIPAESWTPVGTIKLPKDPVLFDIHAHDVNATEKKKSLKLSLAVGSYVVEMATGTAKAKPYPSKIVPMEYLFVRLRPPSWVQPGAKAAKPVVDEGPIVATADVIAKAKKLVVASSDAIPMVLAPRKHLPSWTGMDGDYDRACAVNGVGAIAIGKGKGLVISEPAGMMWWPAKTGGMIVMWHGADSREGCIAAALSIPDGEYKKQKAKLVVEKGAEELVLFESAAEGSSLKKTGTIGDDGEKAAIFKLAAGTYAIDVVWSWEAEVKVGKKIEDTMVGVIRLTRS